MNYRWSRLFVWVELVEILKDLAAVSIIYYYYKYQREMEWKLEGIEGKQDFLYRIPSEFLIIRADSFS